MKTLREVTRYPSAVAGMVIIAALVGLSIYTIISMPYSEAIRLWRGGEEIWHENPKNAQPAWVNLFKKSKLPETIVLNSKDGSATKSVKAVSAALTDVTISFAFEYPYDAFPQELVVYFTAVYSEQQPLVSLSWLTPDGREIRIADLSIKQAETYRASQDDRLTRRLKGQATMQGLFADPTANTPVALKGRYELRIVGSLFEKGAALDAKRRAPRPGLWAGRNRSPPPGPDRGPVVGHTDSAGLRPAGCIWLDPDHHDHCCHRRLVWPLGGRHHPADHRGALDPARAADPDHDRHVLLPKYMADIGRRHRLEHLWGTDQDLPGRLYPGEGRAVHRGRPGVRGGQLADHPSYTWYRASSRCWCRSWWC